jgi:cysteine-rich repeat protein
MTSDIRRRCAEIPPLTVPFPRTYASHVQGAASIAVDRPHRSTLPLRVHIASATALAMRHRDLPPLTILFSALLFFSSVNPCLANPPALAHQASATKASLACRTAIAKTAGKLIRTATKIVDRCHVKRDNGRFVGNCNVLSEADPEGKFAAAVLKGDVAIDKKCGPAEPVRMNYSDGHQVASVLRAAVQEQVETASAFLLPGPPLVGDRHGIHCRKTIRTVERKVVSEIVKLSTQCQKAADKAAATFGVLLAGCFASPSAMGPKAPRTLTKSCGPVTDLSCSPFPECVVTAASDVGHALAAAIYGGPSVCGNAAVEGLEECDDGNIIDGDGCDSNCTHTTCGNGVVTAGEDCDDGNSVSGDGCSSACRREFCGDAIVQPGLGEDCDDGNSVSGDGCSSACRREFCGDAVVQPGLGEDCDDGNHVRNDGCEPNCKKTPQPKVIEGMITSGNRDKDTCVLCDAAFVSFTVDPQKGVMDFLVQVTDPGPGYYFCWRDELSFVQGNKQVQVEVPLFWSSGKALLEVDDRANTCGTKLPGVRLTGKISKFPAELDLTAPFTIFFGRSAVSFFHCFCIENLSCCGNRELSSQ